MFDFGLAIYFYDFVKLAFGIPLNLFALKALPLEIDFMLKSSNCLNMLMLPYDSRSLLNSDDF